jgi:predicted transposase/invertase (TIGR01784 family)
MQKSFISPLNDAMVKGIYGDQKNIGITAELLKPVLGIPAEEYATLTIRDSFLRRLWKKDKQGILDLVLTTTTGKRVNVEVQVLPYKAMIQRIIYYQAKIVTEQMKAGFEYDKIQQTISVVITNYRLLPDEAPYMNTYELRNTASGKQFTDLQKFVILELSKLPEEDDGQAIWPQLRFFKCKTAEDFKMLSKKHPEIRPALAEYQRLSMSERFRKIADHKEKQRRDEWAALEYAKDEGREEGRNEGRAESRQEIAELRRQLQDLGRR